MLPTTESLRKGLRTLAENASSERLLIQTSTPTESFGPRFGCGITLTPTCVPVRSFRELRGNNCCALRHLVFHDRPTRRVPEQGCGRARQTEAAYKYFLERPARSSRAEPASRGQ